ncbi:Fic family protein, partial [Sutterella sp.]
RYYVEYLISFKHQSTMWIPASPYNNLPELPPHFTETIKIFRQTIQSRVALERLHQAVNLLPNNEILIQTIPILEAQASSEIENIVTTTDNLFKFLDADTQADAATKEALRYRQALWKGMDSLKRCPLSLRTMIAVCSTLRDTDVSVRKLDGTCIASTSSGQVIYTPPAGEALILEKLHNLAEFLHSPSEMDPLIKMAIAHYQFEAIHPFSDGNGRTGRVLNILYLVESGLLSQPVLYLSRYIIRNKPKYYAALLNVTKEGAWEDWILFMLQAVEETALWTCQKVEAIVKLERETTRFIQASPLLKGVYSHELVQTIFMRPYCRIATLIDAGIAKRQTAMKYLNLLTQAGILHSAAAGREKLFINSRLMALLKSDLHEYPPLEAV